MFFRRRADRQPGGAAEKGGPVARRLAGFAGNPYLFLGPRPFREARLRSYIVAQHRAGRALSDILSDPYIRRCGSESFCWSVIQNARTIEAFGRDYREAFGRLRDV